MDRHGRRMGVAAPPDGRIAQATQATPLKR